jgi:polyisoprenoid-binding protein YceI
VSRTAAAILALAPALAWAAPEEFLVDRAHTTPGFEVLHLGISTQRGRFERTQGRIVLDREAGTGSMEIEIDARTVTTGNSILDAVLRSEDFFDVERFPTIAFRGARFEFEKGVPRRVHGELTLLGKARPVTLEVERFGCTRLPFFVRTTCGADASARVSRGAFGMSSYSLYIGDEVRIVIQIEAVKVEAPAEPAISGG